MKAFIDEHRAVYEVESICRVLPIAPSTYRAHAARRANLKKASVREKRDAFLRPEIRRVWKDNFHVYGARKVWRQRLDEAGIEPSVGSVGDSYDNALAEMSSCLRSSGL